MNSVVLADDAFYEKYEPAFAEVSDVPLKELEKDFDELDARIQKGFDQLGLKDDDFELSDEWQESFHHCGLIYTELAHSPKTIAVIQDAIGHSKYPERWCFHMSCEAVEDFEGGEDMGQFFILAGTIYFDEDSKGLKSILLNPPPDS